MDPQKITDSSWQSTVTIETIFADLGHQVALLDEVRGHSLTVDVRDRILWSLTAIQKDLESKISSASGPKVETAVNSATHLEMLVRGDLMCQFHLGYSLVPKYSSPHFVNDFRQLHKFRLIDCGDLLVSYSSSQLIMMLAVQPSYQDAIEAALIHQWSEMLSLHCTSATGVLHRIEILRNFFSKKFTSSSSVDFSAQGLQMVIGSLMVEQWEDFLRFLFQSNSDKVRQSHLYPNIIQSTCRLWIKLIRREVQKSFLKGSESVHGKIFCLNDVLLERLKTGSLSQICHRKCLGVLLECLPYSSFLSPLKVIPSLYHELARKNLGAFKNSGVDDLSTENPDDLSRNFRLGTNWIRQCVMRSSIPQGFGGFCSTGESCSDSAVVIDGESTLRGVMTVDETVLRKLVLLWLRSLAVEAHGSTEEGFESSVDDDIWLLLNSLESFVCSLLSSTPDVWLMQLFEEQDDDLFEALLCLLDIYVLTDKWSSDVTCLRFEPCRFFLQFLESGCWDHTLLVDLLMSPETCFLIYLTRLLKHIVSDWDHWVSMCRNYEKEENAVGAAELGVDLSKDFSSCDNNASLDEFKNAFESVEMKWRRSVERFQPVPLSSLKQLEQNYTGLLSEGISGNVADNERTYQGISVTDPSYSSSFPNGKSDSVPDPFLESVRKQSLPRKIIDYSDSDSDGSESAGGRESNVDDEKTVSSKAEISPNDCFVVTDALLHCSTDLDVRTAGNCLKASAEDIALNSADSLRITNEVDAENGQKPSSTSDKCYALDSSKDFSFMNSEQSELPDDWESRMDVETDCVDSDVAYDDLTEKECEKLRTTVMDSTNEVEEQCDVLVDAMTTLIRLRLCLTRLISKDIFPYSIGPLERLLNACEECYEKV